MPNLIIKSFREPPLGNNNYVVIDGVSHEAILIDCSAPDGAIMDFIRDQGATLKYILLTHMHFDHVMGVSYFREKYHTRTYARSVDPTLWDKMSKWLSQNGFPTPDKPLIDGSLDKDSVLMLGEKRVQVLETPGHSPEGVCYLIDGNLFSGDTLFKGTYGRTDVPDGSYDQIQASIRFLLNLPDETVVYPGHGGSTTIGAEREHYR